MDFLFYFLFKLIIQSTIIIKMYNNGEHNPPHFHASYQGYYATFNLDGELIEGDMPKRQIKFIAA